MKKIKQIYNETKKNILVTIPASKLQEVTDEEEDVAQRQAAGEKGITYYWQMGRLPKIQPERIYFAYDGAVRAYHEVLSMNKDEGRIYMKTEIHELDDPIPVKPFRGFRYM